MSAGNGPPSSRDLDRLERRQDDMRNRLGDVERAVAAIPFIQDDISDIKAAVEKELGRIRSDCTTTRTWVEQQIKEREEAEKEEKRLTGTQKAAVTGGLFLLVAAFMQMISTLSSAGLFH